MSKNKLIEKIAIEPYPFISKGIVNVGATMMRNRFTDFANIIFHSK